MQDESSKGGVGGDLEGRPGGGYKLRIPELRVWPIFTCMLQLEASGIRG